MHQPAAAAEAATSGVPPPGFEYAVEAAAAGEATPAQRALLEAHPGLWRTTLERLLDDADDALESVRQITGPERDQVVADFEADVKRLSTAYDLLTLVTEAHSGDQTMVSTPVGEVRLQASWSAGRVVVWGAGPGTPGASADELDDLLRAADAPTAGWTPRSPVPLPGGGKAAAQTVPIVEILGWLVAIGSGLGGSGGTGDSPNANGPSTNGTDGNGTGTEAGAEQAVGASLTWLGRVAVWGMRQVARGAIVPNLRLRRRQRSGEGGNDNLSELTVRWAPALVDQAKLDEMAAAMPGPVAAIERAEARALTLAVLGAIVDAIATDAAGRLEMPAAPPEPRTPAAVAEAVLTRLDGSPFDAPTAAATELSRRIERWARAANPPANARLVVTLEPPDSGNAWFLSVLGHDAEDQLVDVEVALVDSRATQRLADELNRLERLLPALLRPGGARRGQVYLSQEEAWELMTVTGTSLEVAGFDVRVPALSRKKPTPALRMESFAIDDSVVGAHQLSKVRWSAVFDDVELTAADIARLAAEARPLVRSRGKWVELDKADLSEAAAALAERANRTELTGAELLRYAIGLEGSPLAGGIQVGGSGWAADLLNRAGAVSTDPVTEPPGFQGELRAYQAEALAWLGFLDTVELGGILALDMGLGKTPTVLAHLARSTEGGPSLVVAPPAVVGNWASEAARFTPGLRVVIHHGADRASAKELAGEVAGADLVITTYGTAVRDVEAMAEQQWARIVLDEAQAIKNPTSETAQQLRRIPARTRLALTGTPIENGLGDLWALLDFTNPSLVGPRPAFVAQLSSESASRQEGAEHALRALNGILVFRRTKTEPVVAAELPDRIDQLDHCTMTPEQIGLYQAVLDRLLNADGQDSGDVRNGAILAAITALKQICNHPAAYQADDKPLAGRSGKLTRLEEIVDSVFTAGERVLVFTHFAEWGKRLADHLTAHTGVPIACYHGGLARGARDKLVADFQSGEGPGALVLSLKAGGTGLNLTAASHVVLYDRWWNPAVEDQARDRAWRIGQTRTVVSHRLVCPGTVDERVEEVVAGKRHIAELTLPKSSSLSDLDANQLRVALGLSEDTVLTESPADAQRAEEAAA